MLSPAIDLTLVVVTLMLAVAYLAWRKFHSAKSVTREWETGHSGACDSCALIEIRRAQRREKPLELTPPK
ncbi:hypothetical protein IT157_09275 [bacterium]|jgi:hypothetical protein|nr:hypothetical protein [bacterium]